MSTSDKRSITIRDVAHLAGVSIKTVSRVMNGEPRVSPATRDRVDAAMATLGYRPNLNARGLAGDRSFLIGLFYDNPSSHYVNDVQTGAVERCRAAGYHLVVEPCQAGDPGVGALIGAIATQLRLDGAILTPPLVDHAGVLAALRDSGVPVACIGPGGDPGPAIPAPTHVTMDDYDAARQITAHLLGLGHRRIGFIKGHPDHRAAAQRYAGFRDELAARHLPLDPDLVLPGYFSFRIGATCAARMLRREDRPTAIFASNDDMAAAAVSVAQRMGLSVPRHLSVVGFDDTPVARMVWPNLTTIRQPISRMAAVAADLLVARAARARSGADGGGDGEGAARHLLEFDLVIRDSTAPPADPGR